MNHAITSSSAFSPYAAPMRRLGELSPKEHKLYDQFKHLCRQRIPDESAILALINNPAFPVNVYEEYTKSHTPLERACMKGLERVALRLIEKGAEVNVIYGSSHTILHVAFQKGLERVALKMIARGTASKGLIPPNWKITDRGATLDYIVFEYAKDSARVTDVTMQFARTVLLGAMASMLTPHELEHLYQLPSDKIKEMLDRIVTRLNGVLYPAPSMEALERVNAQVNTWQQKGKTPAEIEVLLDTDAATRAVLQQVFRPFRLSRCWQHVAISLPRALQPLAGGWEWHALMPKPFTASNGLTITCLTRSSDLEEESRLLNHCAGRDKEFKIQCCADVHRWRWHFFSIGRMGEDGVRQPLSTLQLRVIAPPQEIDTDTENIPIGNTGMWLMVKEHRGRNNSKTLPAHVRAAWGEFTAALKDGRLSLTLDNEKLGETAASREKHANHSELARTIGYEPDLAHTEKLFDRFRMGERAAVTAIRPDGMRVYDVTQTEDIATLLAAQNQNPVMPAQAGIQQPAASAPRKNLPSRQRGNGNSVHGYTHYEHFIDGFAVVTKEGMPTGRTALRPEHLTCGVDERLVYLRNLDLYDWLRATGLMGKLRGLLREHGFALKPLLEVKLDLTKTPRPIPSGNMKKRPARRFLMQHARNHPKAS